MNKQSRLNAANKFIKTIANCGRRFFFCNGRYAYFEIAENGHIYFCDDYTQRKIYTHYVGRWDGFSHGGTMKSLIVFLRDFIQNGKTMNATYFQPVMGNGYKNPWGYGDDILIVKRNAINLGIANKKRGTKK